MESIFSMYFMLGFHHIADIQGYDHILYVATLVAIYSLSQWRSILVLITGFTLGHSFTLALATLGIVRIHSAVAEILIPITIMATAAGNIIPARTNNDSSKNKWRYALVVVFGLIHGLGFSNYLQNLLSEQDSIFTPLLAFNLGLEAGQIMIVGITLSIMLLYTKYIPYLKLQPGLIVSYMAILMGVWLVTERLIYYLA